MRHFTALPLIFAMAACQQPAPKAASVEAAIVRLPAVKGNPGAAYFILKGGPVDDRLMAVSSPLAVRAEMHEMAMDGGKMNMAPIDGGLAVPAKRQIAFETGGKHVMLFDISPKMTDGEKMPLTLLFASGTTLETQADVVAPGEDAPREHE
jgi:periplasmic copper chaperone A